MNLKSTGLALAVAGAMGVNCCPSFGASVKLAWDPNPNPGARYHIWLGTATGVYRSKLDAGTNSAILVGSLAPGLTYYFNATTYAAQKPDTAYAGEISWAVPMPPTIVALLGAPVVTGSNGLTATLGGSMTVAPGANVSMTAKVGGTFPIALQWQQNGATIAGATNVVLSLTNVTAAKSGSYTLVASNSTASVTSAPIALTVMPLMTGTFTGLFYQTNRAATLAMSVPSSGMLANWTVSSGGAYSGKVCLGGNSYPAVGVFDVYGNSQATVSRASNSLTSLALFLHLTSSTNVGQLSGTVSNMAYVGAFSSAVLADSAGPGSLIGVVLAQLQPSTNLFGPGQLSAVSLLGQTTIAGTLPDGALFTETTPLSVDYDLPVYASLYGGAGVIEGWLNLSNGIPSGSLAWIQLAGVTNSVYPQGFTNILTAAPVLP